MYFADNTIYTYLQDHHTKVYNIGWLDDQYEYRKGYVAPKIIRKLVRIGERMDVNICRGAHFCQYCYKNPTFQIENKNHPRGNGEIWLPNKSFTKVYVAPKLILHYIQAHQYLPPKEFIDAIAGYNFIRRFIFEHIFIKYLIKPTPDL